MVKRGKTQNAGPTIGAGTHVGTSGWSYEPWRDVVYPSELPKKEYFAFFASKFDTVELNATFYRLFPEKNLSRLGR